MRRPAALLADCHDSDRVRLDEDKLDALRDWGERLRQAGGEEHAAVGRAILMLIDEIDQLHIELWHTRLQQGRVAAISGGEAARGTEDPVAATLHERLRRVLRRDSSLPQPRPVPAEEEASDAETDMPTSPQSWIESLRRQK